jgi:tRNA threonylcarbamoyladenosine biosynthesis protein TsaB
MNDMKILALDTTTRFLCLALAYHRNIYECNLDLGRRHSALLVPIIKRSLEALEWRIQDIRYFACGIGPGSFTGVRVGVSAIKGFAWALGKPVLGIPTLDIIAMNALSCAGKDAKGGSIIPVLDAKRGLIYCSVYRRSKGGLKRTMPYMLLSEEDFLRKAPSGSLILGDAIALYKEKMSAAIKGAVLLDKDYWYPQAHNIIPLSLEKIDSGKIDNVFTIKPIYLYPKDCQIKQSHG